MHTSPIIFAPGTSGALTTDMELPKLPTKYAGRVGSLQAFADTAGTGTSTFDVLVNGVSVFSVKPTLTAGQTEGDEQAANAGASWAAGDIVEIVCLSITGTEPRGVRFILAGEWDGVPNDTLRLVAHSDVSQYRVVKVRTDGTVQHADSTNLAGSWQVVGIAAAAAATGAAVSIVVSGTIENPAWEWAPGDPIYFDDTGALTQDAPTEGFLLPVAVPLSATRILVRVLRPFPMPAVLDDFGITDALQLFGDEIGDPQTGSARISGLFKAARLLLGAATGYAGVNKLVVGLPNENYEDAEIVVSPSTDEKVCLVLERKTETQSTPLLRITDENGDTLGEINQTAGWNAPASTTYVATVQCSLIQSAGNLDVRIVGTDRLHFEYTGDIVVRDNTRLVENVKTLTPGATVALSSIQGNCFVLTPDQDCTININNSYPDALYNGQEFDLVLVASGTTSRVVTLGTGFLTDDATIDTGTEDGKRFILSFRVVGGVAIERSRKGPM